MGTFASAGGIPAAISQQGEAGVGPPGGSRLPPGPQARPPTRSFPAAKLQPEETPQLMRTRSDVGVRRRGSTRTPSEQRRIRRHRFSINGHFYNHKVSPKLPETSPDGSVGESRGGV